MEKLIEYILGEAKRKYHEHPSSVLIGINNTTYWNYSLYQDREKRKQLCRSLERYGYSCRIGLQVHWDIGQGMQAGFIELSQSVKFLHINVEDYKHEVKQGEC